jgi:two-component system C4-dicarboxylate transport sensor histidine kinase DctB
MKPELETDPSVDPRWAAHRMAAVGSIAALVGHRARNRLTVVRAALELLEAGAAGDLTTEQGSAFLGELDRFLGDFNLGLEMIRCQPTHAQSVAVREVIAEALEKSRLPAERAGTALRFEDTPGDDAVSADPLLLRQSILNLIRNGLEALDGRAGGEIIVRSIAGAPWIIEVEDNGPGLPASMKECDPDEIFAPIGRGLGLPLCRDAMTLMGGAISYVASGEKPGACFRLTLARA